MASAKIDIYNYDKQISQAITRLNNSDIPAKNKKAILSFIEFIELQGLTKPRILFYLERLYQIAQLTKNDFAQLTRKDIEQIVKAVNAKGYTEHTRIDYLGSFKRFYKHVKGWEGKEGYPEDVAWIKTSMKSDRERLPEDLLSQEDVEKLISSADHIRDKALISTLFETGCRVGELASLRLKHVSFDKYGAVILVNGKTGMRRVRMIMYSQYLSRWLSEHPDKDDPNAALWVVIGTTKNVAKSGKLDGYKFKWSYELKHHTIMKAIQRAADKAGIKKKVNPHNFRHSRATILASKLTEAQLKEMFGWTQSSDMAAVYVHMSGRDVDDALLKLHGLQEEKPDNESSKAKRCPRCKEINPPNFKFCGGCSLPLDTKAAIELEENRKNADDLMSELVKDPEVQKLLVEKVMKKGLAERLLKK
ncbi:tyrosine-type recombinase/integrase [Candidatus Woesearchaeota archaeon]|nr:tyrosine-type recombinase/integrase [Candidatus Woesearchaeota archaeon]